MKEGLLALALLMLVMGCGKDDPPAETPITAVKVEEVSPEEVYRVTDSVRIVEETVHIRPVLPFGREPGNTITSIGDLEAGKDGVVFGARQHEFLSSVSQGTVILYFLGGACVVIGVVVVVWLKRLALGIGVAGGGLAVITIAMLYETYPWLILLLVLLAAGAGIWFILASRKGKRLRDAITAIVRGVENADMKSQVDVKRKIKDAANGNRAVKAEVAAAKYKVGAI